MLIPFSYPFLVCLTAVVCLLYVCIKGKVLYPVSQRKDITANFASEHKESYPRELQTNRTSTKGTVA